MLDENTIHSRWSGAPDAVGLIGAHHHLWDLGMRRHPNLIGPPRGDFFMGDDTALRRHYLSAGGPVAGGSRAVFLAQRGSLLPLVISRAESHPRRDPARLRRRIPPPYPICCDFR